MSNYWKDVLERLVWTFIQAFLASLTAASFIGDIDALTAAAIAGIAAVLSLLKSVAAKRLAELGTAQLIPFSGGTYEHTDEAGH